MALLDVKIRSKVLGLSTSLHVILPQEREVGAKLPVLWLLHGMSDDHSGFIRRSSIERYVEDKKLCVIMPAVDLSFYTDMAYGNRYFTYMTEELPEIMQSMFSLSDRRENNYVAGLSMGGYGAFKIALNYPDRYCAGASLSGALDMVNLFDREDDPCLQHRLQMAFGSREAFIGSENDLRHMAALRAKEQNFPRLYMCCGMEDFLYEANKQYLAHLQHLHIPVTYEEEKGYAHTWDYWDLKIQQVLAWMGV